MKGIDEAIGHKYFNIVKVHKPQRTSFEILSTKTDKKIKNSKPSKPKQNKRPFALVKVLRTPSSLEKVTESQLQSPNLVASSCDMDVNMTEISDDCQSKDSLVKFPTNQEAFEIKSNSTLPCSRRESGISLISQELVVPEFFHDRPTLQNFNIRKTFDFENKEMYLIDKSTCFPQIYHSKLALNEFNEDVYFNFE
jgi:hypothetical protein